MADLILVVCSFVAGGMVFLMLTNWYLDSRTPDLDEVMKKKDK